LLGLLVSELKNQRPIFIDPRRRTTVIGEPAQIKRKIKANDERFGFDEWKEESFDELLLCKQFNFGRNIAGRLGAFPNYVPPKYSNFRRSKFFGIVEEEFRYAFPVFAADVPQQASESKGQRLIRVCPRFGVEY
jgi:hypothetical protein